ncbi:MAG: gliding motility-associated C-terminal domain-containing protein, partial [Saprospiraceae bacterium]|nr:gliding motility-associated C-terminal domain-containing protein [Saprospiraceae bacterium]
RIFVSAATLSVDGDTTICKNFSAPLSASSNLTGTFQWRNDLTGQIISTMQVTAVSPAATTPYTLIFTYGDNCQLSKPVLVQVDGEAPTIVFPADPRLCPGESTPLNTGPVLTGAQYHWSAVPADPLLADTLPNPIVQPGQDTRYTVTAALGNCSVTRSIDVVAYAANLTLTGPETICAGASALLVASGSNPNGSYFWSNGATTASINPAPTAPTTYTVTFAFGDTCSLKKSVLVNVVDNFKLNLQSFPDTNQVFVGTPVTLIALTDPPQNLSNFNLGWEEKTVDTKLLPFTTESVEVVPSSNDTTVAEVTYKVTLTTANGCQKTASKTFKLIFPKVDFPNAFTPDNDGENDVFRMVILNGLAVVDRMEIFNRWGQKIYESTDPAASWDGTVNGEPVPSDVYVYRVWWRRGDGALQVQSQGNITLLR